MYTYFYIRSNNPNTNIIAYNMRPNERLGHEDWQGDREYNGLL